ncbi:hypothetical protein AB0L40_21180 [Patulibacter sp. NPDC049589]|uniref:hypothetical protein n=1 Tax=Patulibacter sp. NPDC049589 TaxID=3154731 RepID=UPI00343A7DD1
MPSTAEPVVLEVGRYTGPRLRVGSVTCLVLGAVAVVGGVAAAGGAVLVLSLLVGVLLLLAGLLLTVAANAARDARFVVDEQGVTWDAGAATWHAGWEELSGVGLSVLRSRRRARTADGPGGERVIRVLMAFHDPEPDAGSAPLRRLRTTDEPAPWTHRMPFASRGDWAARLDEGLARLGGERYAGMGERDVLRGRGS